MTQRIHIGSPADFPPGTQQLVSADGKNILVFNIDGKLCTVQNRCSHLALPLKGGAMEGTTLTCPWHNSSFNVCTGENVDWVRGILGVRVPLWSRRMVAAGRKPTPLRTYAVSVEGDGVYLEV